MRSVGYSNEALDARPELPSSKTRAKRSEIEMRRDRAGTPVDPENVGQLPGRGARAAVHSRSAGGPRDLSPVARGSATRGDFLGSTQVRT